MTCFIDEQIYLIKMMEKYTNKQETNNLFAQNSYLNPPNFKIK